MKIKAKPFMLQNPLFVTKNLSVQGTRQMEKFSIVCFSMIFNSTCDFFFNF